MINVYSNSGDTAYGIREWVVDTIDDIQSLPTAKIELGSAALCLEDGKVYFFNSVKKGWFPLGES